MPSFNHQQQICLEHFKTHVFYNMGFARSESVICPNTSKIIIRQISYLLASVQMIDDNRYLSTIIGDKKLGLFFNSRYNALLHVCHVCRNKLAHTNNTMVPIKLYNDRDDDIKPIFTTSHYTKLHYQLTFTKITNEMIDTRR